MGTNIEHQRIVKTANSVNQQIELRVRHQRTIQAAVFEATRGELTVRDQVLCRGTDESFRSPTAGRTPAASTAYGISVINPALSRGERQLCAFRDQRAAMVQTYCMFFIDEQPNLQTIVGLALNIYVDDGTIKTRSEDLLACDAPSLTPEFRRSLEEARIAFGLKDPAELERHAVEKRLRNPFRINRGARHFR